MSEPLQSEGNVVVALGVADSAADGNSSVHVVSLKDGDTVEKLSLRGLGLSTDSGAAVGLTLLALGRRGESSDHRCIGFRSLGFGYRVEGWMRRLGKV